MNASIAVFNKASFYQISDGPSRGQRLAVFKHNVLDVTPDLSEILAAIREMTVKAPCYKAMPLRDNGERIATFVFLTKSQKAFLQKNGVRVDPIITRAL
jgi:hypothetical protein